MAAAGRAPARARWRRPCSSEPSGASSSSSPAKRQRSGCCRAGCGGGVGGGGCGGGGVGPGRGAGCWGGQRAERGPRRPDGGGRLDGGGGARWVLALVAERVRREGGPDGPPARSERRALGADGGGTGVGEDKLSASGKRRAASKSARSPRRAESAAGRGPPSAAERTLRSRSGRRGAPMTEGATAGVARPGGGPKPPQPVATGRGRSRAAPDERGRPQRTSSSRLRMAMYLCTRVAPG